MTGTDSQPKDGAATVMRDPLYVIADWDKHFETSRTRGISSLKYVLTPLKRGDGYCDLVANRHGAANLGAWNALISVACSCETRGVLLKNNGKPHTPKSLAKLTHLPERAFSRMLEQALEIGWVTVQKPLGDVRVTPQKPLSDVPKATLRETYETVTEETVFNSTSKEGNPTANSSSDSGSGPTNAVTARFQVCEAIRPLWAPRATAQYQSDVTSTDTLSGAVWDARLDLADNQARVAKVLGWAKTAHRRKNPMAWMTTQIQSLNKETGVVT